MATFAQIENRPALRFERRLEHPPDAVWRAITDPEELWHWFPTGVEVDLRVGGAMKFTFRELKLSEQPTTMDGEVTDFDPPRVFGFYWGRDHLRFELEPLEGGAATRLRFTVLLDAPDKAARDAAGWHVCLDRLAQQLSGAPTQAPGSGPTSEWRSHYDEYARQGMPTGAEIPGNTSN
jgi:uncharacterized protein YndB with AHSA1/START domain